MNINYEELQAGLGNLRGIDLEEAERAERATGNNFPTLSFSSSFQARLAAKALGKNPHDLKALPLKDYNKVCNMVFNFLFSSEETQSANSEA